MRISFPCLAGVALLALCGCATTPPNSSVVLSDDQAVLAPRLTCTIPPPGNAGGTVNVAQSIVARFRGQTFYFDVQIQATPDNFELVALDALGRRAMSVKWHGGQMDYTRASWLPDQVRPADILADMAVVYWPTGVVAAALAACGANLIETGSGREVKAGERALIAVTYERGEGWNRPAHLHNMAFGFDIDIESAEIAP
jgi:hypothetical protein